MRLIFSLHWFTGTLYLYLRDVYIAKTIRESVCISQPASRQEFM